LLVRVVQGGYQGGNGRRRLFPELVKIVGSVTALCQVLGLKGFDQLSD
jgi:hypothetical protein